MLVRTNKRLQSDRRAVGARGQKSLLLGPGPPVRHLGLVLLHPYRILSRRDLRIVQFCCRLLSHIALLALHFDSAADTQRLLLSTHTPVRDATLSDPNFVASHSPPTWNSGPPPLRGTKDERLGPPLRKRDKLPSRVVVRSAAVNEIQSSK